MPNTPDTLEDALRPARGWLVDRALPLWAEVGFDRSLGLFEERLGFDGRPAPTPRRRLMVQCRQIATFARASIAGFRQDGGRRTSDAFDRVRRTFRAADGSGWTFASSPDGADRDETRDLYGYAFVLYALGWLHRLTGGASFLTLADQTIGEIDLIFAADGPGHLSRSPGGEGRREQNPHMHLLEAYLALHESSGREFYLERAARIIALFDSHLFDAASGSVREIFNDDWSPARPVGDNPIEPGHHFEWAWLLGQYEAFSAVDTSERQSLLIGQAMRFGLDPGAGAIFDEIRERGDVVSSATRVWPQTEAIRTLSIHRSKHDVASAITARLMEKHLPASLDGGWFDRLDANGAPSVDHMPASTLYHVAGALIDASAATLSAAAEATA